MKRLVQFSVRKMKIFCAKLILVFVMSTLASAAFAFEPAQTLKDNENGMTVDLYPVDGNFLFYGNIDIGYNVNIPHNIFTEVIHLSENGNGMILGSKDGTARFSLTGGFMMDGESEEGKLRESYDNACKAIGGEEEAVYSEIGDDYWELSWIEEDTLHRREFLIKRGLGVWCELQISYFRIEGDVDPIHKLFDESLDSLAFPEG